MPRHVAPALAVGLAVYVGALYAAGIPTRVAPAEAAAPSSAMLPAITILPSRGVVSQLDDRNARAVVAALHASPNAVVQVWLEPGQGQAPPIAVAHVVGGSTYRLQLSGTHWVTASGSPSPALALPPVKPIDGFRLASVAPQLGLNFTESSFRFGVTPDPAAMMGGGLCWLDYNNDGWLDLYAVNNYTDSQYAKWEEHGGPPTGQLFENVHGHFVNVTKAAHLNVPTRGEGCVAGDFNGDGRTDLFVTTATDDLLFWNNGNGTFTEGARAAGIVSYGWHSGAAIADVNGDGRPDLFVSGYTDLQHPIVDSLKGFPSNYKGEPNELFINLGHKHFRNVTKLAGLDDHPNDHSLGAVFVDVNGDGRPDLYVANDEDPNRLYLNEPGGPLGFHFVDVSKAYRVADTNAGMGVATGWNGAGNLSLFISNSRGQGNAAYRWNGSRFVDVRSLFKPIGGVNPTGWGDSWIDLRNNGTLDLLITNGAIPVTNQKRDAAPVQVLVPKDGRYVDAGILRGIRVNGRGLAAADYDNDGRVDVAVGTVGGKLVLLRNTSPAGHWLEINVAPFSPGAVVTLVGANGKRQIREVQAGTSYLSSEDPRIHFGLGDATSARELIVRYPDGTVKTLRGVRADQILTVQR